MTASTLPTPTEKIISDGNGSLMMTSPGDILSLQYAQKLDNEDDLRHFRNEFLIPSKTDLKRKQIKNSNDIPTSNADEQSVYLCGNSLGLQPKRTQSYITSYLLTWSASGVYGHFNPLQDQKTVPWVDIGDQAAEAASKIVGASPSEVAVMQTLTANLHLLMASFYRPTKEKYRIIIEGKAFPSDHYAVLSQVMHHGYTFEDAVIMLQPSDAERHYFSTESICESIEKHAESTALVLLPGVHYYSGQFFDIPTITKFAHSKGLTIGWDLAHAAGNVPLHLHEWDVDFAAWCSYKYLNSGPGSIAGLFVHERHGRITRQGDIYKYTPRYSGWWGSDKSSRFRMENQFVPIEGARGWQLSNPSVFDCTSVIASLSVFNETSMEVLRAKSVKLTAYLEMLLQSWPMEESLRSKFMILTPKDPQQRGAQLSVKLAPQLLDPVMAKLEEDGVVVDERRPDVVRVAPAPLYNSFEDVWHFMTIFHGALQHAVSAAGIHDGGGGIMLDGPTKSHGWAEVT